MSIGIELARLGLGFHLFIGVRSYWLLFFRLNHNRVKQRIAIAAP
jgi:hypothetical protein